MEKIYFPIQNEEEMLYRLFHHCRPKQDLLINPLGLHLVDLSQDTIKVYRQALDHYRKDEEIASLSDRDFLVRIGAYRKDEEGKEGLINGAILFFGKWQDIIQIYPNYFLDYQYYDGSNLERWKRRFTSDDLSTSGNIYDFYLKVKEAITPVLPNPFKREDDNNYDGKDIRDASLEVLVNSLSNASYVLGSGVLVKVSPNYFHVRNSGDILVGKEQAINGGLSSPRNSSILRYFRLIGAAERAGLGVPKVYEVASRYSFPTPSLSENKINNLTNFHFSFLTLPRDTPSREMKLKIIAYLADKEEGSLAIDIAEELKLSKSQVSLAIRELILTGIVVTNNKEKKGRRVYLSKEY